MRGLAGRPGERAVRAQSNLINPSSLIIGGEDRVFAASIGGHQGAVIAAGENQFAVGRARQNAAGMNGHALFAALGREQQRFLAQHKHRSGA
jgi:hypothetical protein